MFQLTTLRILIVIPIILFALSSSKAQGRSKYLVPYLNLLPGMEDPAVELELLPDTPSYHTLQEIYNADTLTYQGNKVIFHNNGKNSYSIFSIDPSFTAIIHLEKISTSYWLQTSYEVDRPTARYDTTKVWWKDGFISNASVLRYNHWRDYSYEYDKGKLIQKTEDYGNGDIRKTSFFYDGDHLVKMLYVDDNSRSETSFSYTDSLITSTTTAVNKSSQYLINGYTRLDDKGRIASIKTFMKRPKESEASLFQSEDYIYHPDNGYQVTYTIYLKDGPYTSRKEIHPGFPNIEKWTWESEDQVWILRSYPH